MESIRFDALLRSVATKATRRGVLAGVIGGLLMALPFAEVGNDVEAKHKKQRRRRKKRKTTSALPAACTPSCGSRTCGGDGCGGSCGRCTAGQACLPNGSCATVCDELADCATGCSCNGANIEGMKTCGAPGFTCEGFPQVCTGTAACPPGQTCTLTGCGQGGSIESRCIPLCAG